MRLHALHVAFAVVAALLASGRAMADALVVNRAMQATTIVEIFVEPDAVRVDLEIGVPDLVAFRDILPDEVLELLELEPEPLATRLERFCREGFVVRADGGEPLPGRLEKLEARPRIKRDEITGEPLPESAGDEAPEPVVFAVLAYPLPVRPSTLSFATPRTADSGIPAANVGFMVYHESLPVIDFRYLSTDVTLDLDWTDPWHSRFRNRNLRRQFDAPLSVFLYVDAYEVRKEIIVRPLDLEEWVDLGIGDAKVIPAAQQAAIRQRAAEFLAEHGALVVDGTPVQADLDRVHFVERTLRRTGVVDPPRDLPAVAATLGVIFVHPVPALPEEVTLTWELFPPDVASIPGVATDEAGGLPMVLTPDDPVLRWQNFLTNPTARGMVEVEPPPPPPHLVIPIVSAACLLLAIGLAASAPRSLRRLGGAAALVAAAALTWPFARASVPNPLGGRRTIPEAQASAILGDLLRNVYRAFDEREETAIYDALERSASGDLLTQVYLETQRALELRNQGGARAKVDEVQMIDSATSRLDDGVGFTSRCRWNVAGSVGHWGHLHQRRNQYEAELRVEPVDGVWKITGLDLLGEQRVQ